MKKLLQTLFSLIIISTSVVAQPTLTGALNNPIVGDVFVVRNTNSVAPGSAGASQTWNLSSMAMSSTTTWSVLNSASTPSGSSFPSANVSVYDGTNYGYYQTSASQWLNYGAVGGGVVFSYTNAEVTLNYPCNYGNSVVDAWGCNFTTGSFNFARYGTSTITADGYGTVTTPAGTYANVMRIHLVQVYKDSAIGFPIMINYTNDQYGWVKPGTHYFLATTFTLTSSSGVSSGGSYLNSIVSSVEENENLLSSFNLFPNPASENLSVTCNLEANKPCELFIYNGTGQMVKHITESETVVGENKFKLEISDLSSGIYYLQMNVEGVLVKNQRFVITN